MESDVRVGVFDMQNPFLIQYFIDIEIFKNHHISIDNNINIFKNDHININIFKNDHIDIAQWS